MTPPEKVLAAMPGTLADISRRTEYPIPVVHKLLVQLRSDGVRVNAVSDVTQSGITKLTPILPDVLTTVYEVATDVAPVDSSSEKA